MSLCRARRIRTAGCSGGGEVGLHVSGSERRDPGNFTEDDRERFEPADGQVRRGQDFAKYS